MVEWCLQTVSGVILASLYVSFEFVRIHSPAFGIVYLLPPLLVRYIHIFVLLPSSPPLLLLFTTRSVLIDTLQISPCSALLGTHLLGCNNYICGFHQNPDTLIIFLVSTLADFFRLHVRVV